LQRYLVDWRQLKPGTTGHDLQKLGLPPGPLYDQLLTRLRAAWLDGQVQNAADEARLVGELIERSRMLRDSS
jgi:tRNA nucleotidyltransferase (CCA-adding enzyme)